MDEEEDEEKPNTQVFFDNTIARIIFESDEERDVYWIKCKDFPLKHFHHHHHIPLHFYLGGIEPWRIANGLPRLPSQWTESDWTLFILRWGYNG